MKNLKFGIAGILFGIILVKAEVISWFRIQEMFRLESFHMYGVIGSAIFTAMLGVLLIRKMGWRSMSGEEIVVRKKPFTKGNVIGGLIFGLGWAITGACPGPIFAQIGSGFTVVFITLLSAIAGTWAYGKWKDRLPH
ncbi:DUF6691 family protein [Chitinophaga caseinilytica]|uniref:DUF6691 family protein n=1 Tax=Chitinophaga caseinilytica TaxID=2267521 RepID=A0ABZ2YY69_9BACT